MGATPKMNRSAKGGVRSSLHYGDEGVLIHPIAPRCLRTARYGRTACDLRRTGRVFGVRMLRWISSLGEIPVHHHPRILAARRNRTDASKVHTDVALFLHLANAGLRKSCMREIRTCRLSGGRRPARKRASSDPTVGMKPGIGRQRAVWYAVILLAVIGVAVAGRRMVHVVPIVLRGYHPPAAPSNPRLAQFAALDDLFARYPILTLVHIVPGL